MARNKQHADNAENCPQNDTGGLTPAEEKKINIYFFFITDTNSIKDMRININYFEKERVFLKIDMNCSRRMEKINVWYVKYEIFEEKWHKITTLYKDRFEVKLFAIFYESRDWEEISCEPIFPRQAKENIYQFFFNGFYTEKNYIRKNKKHIFTANKFDSFIYFLDWCKLAKNMNKIEIMPSLFKQLEASCQEQVFFFNEPQLKNLIYLLENSKKLKISDYLLYFSLLRYFNWSKMNSIPKEIITVIEPMKNKLFASFKKLILSDEPYQNNLEEIFETMVAYFPYKNNINFGLSILQKIYDSTIEEGDPDEVERVNNYFKKLSAQIMFKFIGGKFLPQKEEILFVLKFCSRIRFEFLELIHDFEYFMKILSKTFTQGNLDQEFGLKATMALERKIDTLVKNGELNNFMQKVFLFNMLIQLPNVNNYHGIFRFTTFFLLLRKIFIEACSEKNDLTEIFGYYKIICENGKHNIFSEIVNYLSYEKKRLEDVYLNILEYAVLDKTLEQDIKTGLERINNISSYILPKHIPQLNLIAKKSSFFKLKQVFQICNYDLDNILRPYATQEIENINKLEICEELLTFLIEKKMKTNPNRYEVIDRIIKWVERSEKQSISRSVFYCYVKENIYFFFGEVDPEKVITKLFQHHEILTTKEYINLFKSADILKSKSFCELREHLLKNFENWQIGKVLLVQFLPLSKNITIQQHLKDLYRVLDEHKPEWELPIEKYNQFNEKQNKIKNILDETCKGCKDYQTLRQKVVLESSEYQFFELHEIFNNTELIDLQESFQEYEWLISNQSMKIDFQNNLNPQYNCQEKLHIFAEKRKAQTQKVENLKKEYRNKLLENVLQNFEFETIRDLFTHLVNFMNKQNKEDVKILNILLFIQNFPEFQEYCDLYNNFVEIFEFKFENSDEKNDLAQEILRIDVSKTELGVIEDLLDDFVKIFEPLADARRTLENMKVFSKFKRHLEFLKKVSGSYDRLKDFVTDMQDYEISWNHINDLEIIDGFINKWKEYPEVRNITALYDTFLKTQRENERFRNIQDKLSNFKKILNQFVQFFEHSSRGAESKLKWVKQVMSHSEISVYFKTDTIKFSVTLIQNENERQQAQNKEFEDFLDLQNAIRMKANPKDADMKETEPLKQFMAMVDLLSSLNNSFKQLRVYGFDVNNQVVKFEVKDSKFDLLKQSKERFEDQRLIYRDEIMKAYKKSYLMTFLHEEMILNFAQNMNKAEKSDFHMFMGLKISMETQKEFQEKYEKLDDKKRLDFVSSFLDDSWTSSSFYRGKNDRFQSLVPTNQEKVYLHEYQPDSKILFRTLLSISMTVNGQFPLFHNILFCSSKTSSGAILAFLYRIFTCRVNNVFMIVNPENLLHELQQDLIAIYMNLKKSFSRNSYLFLVHCNIHSIIFRYFTEQDNYSRFDLSEAQLQEKFDGELEKYQENVTILHTEKALDGKSYYIRQEVKKQGSHKYAILRLTGRISFISILASLKRILKDEKIALHIEIGQIEEENFSLLDEVLFSLVFLKCLAFEHDVTIVPNETKFFIEFDSSKFEKVFNSLSFCNFGFTLVKKIEQNSPILPLTPLSYHFLELTADMKMNSFDGNFIEKSCGGLINDFQNFEALRNLESNEGYVHFRPTTPYPNGYVENYKKYVKEYGFKDMQFPERCIVRLFEKIISFQAFGFARSSFFLNFDPLEPKINRSRCARIIIQSASFFSKNAKKSLELQQTAQQVLLNSNNEFREDDFENENRDIFRVGDKDIFFMVFFNDYPVFAYSDLRSVPEEIRKLDDTNSRFIPENKRNHEFFFKEITHINDKIFSCYLCEKCGLRFNNKSCMKCHRPFMTAQDFYEDFKDDVLRNIGGDANLYKNLQENQKIIEFKKYLKTISETELDIKTTKDCVCLRCFEVNNQENNCINCQTELINSEKFLEKNKNSQFFKNIHAKHANSKIPEKFGLKIPSSDLNDHFKQHVANVVQKYYVLTQDNYIKILSIYVRAKSRLPIVIMGETGCGKTSLIRFLCTFVLNDYFELLSIHAGTTEKTIVERMNKFITVCNLYPQSDCWLVFDEFNTSEAYGLIKTMMVERRLESVTLPLNAILIATCNPFKLKTRRAMEQESVGLKRTLEHAHNKNIRLLYTVKPIPESLMLYTFNFGQLSPSDEQLYIQSILSNTVAPKYNQMVSKLIMNAHNFIKSKLDLSATSLRDLRRFQIVHKFFEEKYLTMEDQNNQEKREKRNIILSFMICYFYRLSDTLHRNELIQILAKCMETKVNNVNSIIDCSIDNLMKCFKMEKGIIQNNALRENIFCMFVCLLNKIPLIIIGKPGSSKSLSLQLIFSRLKGRKSAFEYFHNFPELAMVPYQGSEYSTSEGIEKVFTTSEKLNEGKDDFIPVVAIDEIGLAEVSKNNPLKVLHSKLEIENIRVGFIGISNWHLDSSKMNRALALSRKDPDKEELINTAIQMILSIISINRQLFKRCMRAVAEAYTNLKAYLKEKNNNEEGIFGLRDFYHMIKFIGARFMNVDEVNQMDSPTLQYTLYSTVKISILRNFSFKKEYAEKMWEFFTSALREGIKGEIASPGIDKLLTSNLNEQSSRFLMIITDHAEVHTKVYELLAKRSRSQIIIGSRFEDDIDSENYCVDVISRIINVMDSDCVLSLHQLQKTYTSLYDLFNQNYTGTGDEKYCRIVQGTISKSLYPVNANFKVVLFMTDKEQKNADEPLINRFEKYSLTRDDFYTNFEIRGLKLIKKYRNLLFGDKNDKKEMRRIFGNFDEVTMVSWFNRMEVIRRDLPFEEDQDPNLYSFLFLMKEVANLNLSQYFFKQKKIYNNQKLLKEFLEYKKRTLHNLLTQLPAQSAITIVYTFSSLFVSLREGFDQNQEALDMLEKEGYTELNLHVFKTEVNFMLAVKAFVADDSKKFLVIKVMSNKETHFMYYLQVTLSQILAENFDKQKQVLLVVYFKQDNLGGSPPFPISPQCKDYFLDDLFQPLDEDSEKIILEPALIKTIEHLKPVVLGKFDRIVDAVFQELVVQDEGVGIINKIQEYYGDFTKKYGEEVTKFIFKKILRACQKDRQLSQLDTIFDLISRDTDQETGAASLVQNIDMSVTKLFQKKLGRFLKVLETHKLIYPLRDFVEDKNKLMIRKWIGMIDTFVTNDRINTPIFDKVDAMELGFPFSHKEYESIMGINIPADMHPTEESILMVFEKFKETSFLQGKYSFYAELEEESDLDKLLLLLCDLVYIDLFNRKEQAPHYKEIKIVVKNVFGERLVQVLKKFVFDPHSISFMVSLMHEFYVLSKSDSIFVEINEEIRRIEDFQDFSFEWLRKLFERLLTKQTLLEKDKIIAESADRICGKADIIEEFCQRNIEGTKCLNLWANILNMLSQFKNHHEMLTFLFDEYGYNPKSLIDNFDNHQQLIKVLNEMNTKFELDLEKKLVQFEVCYYQFLLSNIQDGEVDQLRMIFESVFKRCEESESFHLAANSIFMKMIVENDYIKNIKKYINAEERRQRDDWLSRQLANYPKRVPYLLIKNLTDSLEANISPENLDEELLRKIFRSFDEINFNQTILRSNEVYALSMMRFLLIYYTKNLERPEFLHIEAFMRRELALQKPINKSLQIFVVKFIKKTKGLNFQELEKYCRSINHEWMIQLFDQINAESIPKTENSHCAPLDSIPTFDLFGTLNEHFYSEPHLGLAPFTDYLKEELDRDHLLGYYCLVINKYYIDLRVMGEDVKIYRTALDKSKEEIVKIFGKLGFQFLLKLTENFDNNSPLSINANTSADVIRRNVNILFAFAAILSHKHESTLLGFLLHKNKLDADNIYEHLKETFLPGMILPENRDLMVLISEREVVEHSWFTSPGYTEIIKNEKKIYKCSKTCNFMFTFTNCGRPTGDQKNCPLCNNLYGGVRYKVALPHHIIFEKAAGIEFMENFIKNYKNGYKKGFFNSKLDIRDLNIENLNVEFRVSNFLNFLSNSLALVLYYLKLSDGEFEKFFPEKEPILNLMKKIDSNYNQLAKDFKTGDIHVFMNCLIANISSKAPQSAPINDSNEYYAQEKLIQSQILNPIMNQFEININNSKALISKIKKDSNYQKNTLRIIEELSWDNTRFPFLKHLRLSRPKISFEEFVIEFQNKSVEFKNKHPVLNYCLKNLNQISAFKIILHFKNFYDPFYQNFNGTFGRIRAQQNISLFKADISKEHTPDFFIKSWNHYFQDQKNEQFECQNIKIEQIKPDGPMNALLPCSYRDNNGMNIILGMRNLIDLHNQMKRKLQISQKTDTYNWKHVSPKSIFTFDENRLAEEINENCIHSHIDYGQLGATSIDFSWLEKHLMEKVDRMNCFKVDNYFLPHFTYHLEGQNINKHLITLRDSGSQAVFSKEQTEKYTQILTGRKRHLANRSYYAMIFTFIESVLLPRALFIADEDRESTIEHFLQRTTSKENAKSSPFQADLNDLKVPYIFSFTLLVQHLLFQEKFVDSADPMTRLDTASEDPKWIALFKKERDAIFELQIWKQHKDAFTRALGRLVLALTFNDENISHPLTQYINEMSLWEFDVDEKLIDEINLGDLELKHSFLLHKEILKKDTQKPGIRQQAEFLRAPRDALDMNSRPTASCFRNNFNHSGW